MTKEMNVKTVRCIIYSIYILTFFIPIYHVTILGVVYKSSIYSLQAGLFFTIFFFLVTASTITIQYIKEEWTKLAFLISSLILVLFLLILLLLKSSIYSISIAFYVQLILICYILFLQFAEKKALLVLQLIGEYSIKFYRFIEKKIKELIQNRKNKKIESEEQANEETN